MVDTTDPTLVCPQDTTVECIRADCPALPVLGLPLVEDACGSEVTLTFSDAPMGDGRLDYSTIRTYTAVDEDGNTSACTQIITETNSAGPEVICPLSGIKIHCEDLPMANLGIPFVTDECTATEDLISGPPQDTEVGSEDGRKTYDRVWTFSDGFYVSSCDCIKVMCSLVSTDHSDHSFSQHYHLPICLVSAPRVRKRTL